MSHKEVPADFSQEVRHEYDRCLHLAAHPKDAPELLGVSGDEAIKAYYASRAEALGWVIDRIDRRGVDYGRKVRVF